MVFVCVTCATSAHLVSVSTQRSTDFPAPLGSARAAVFGGRRKSSKMNKMTVGARHFSSPLTHRRMCSTRIEQAFVGLIDKWD